MAAILTTKANSNLERAMTDDVKTALHDTLRRAREANLSKLEGLSEYDLRRPMTPTGSVPCAFSLS
ncbi:hypothetical protein ACIA49_03190 [Kribbella sp. NPDC051587]|uniref:hypothetical protein n=1 Tax=Kribbella sp. NPDC051587 TaxID=3364119 RepID=UPI00378B9319